MISQLLLLLSQIEVGLSRQKMQLFYIHYHRDLEMFYVVLKIVGVF